jgi:hypothetical protein
MAKMLKVILQIVMDKMEFCKSVEINQILKIWDRIILIQITNVE